MAEYPRSLPEFQRRFPDDAACGEYLARTRWPGGFACPRCGGREAWRLPSRTPLTFGCKGCGKETSVTAGTVMHRTHLPLSVWFWAAWLVATHSNGMSAKQLQSELAIASYETAWLLSMKLRAAMVAPERTPLSGLVEADETTIPFRTKDDPPAGGQGRSHDGKLLLIGAVEVVSGKNEKLTLGRLRLAPIADFARNSLHAFIAANTAPGSIVKTDGLAAYLGPPNVTHEPHVVGTMAAHVVLPGIHRVFSNLKTRYLASRGRREWNLVHLVNVSWMVFSLNEQTPAGEQETRFDVHWLDEHNFNMMRWRDPWQSATKLIETMLPVLRTITWPDG